MGSHPDASPTAPAKQVSQHLTRLGDICNGLHLNLDPGLTSAAEARKHSDDQEGKGQTAGHRLSDKASGDGCADSGPGK